MDLTIASSAPFNVWLDRLKESKTSFVKPKAYSVAKIRETHKRAYAPWTSDMDDRLTYFVKEGNPTRVISQLMQRSTGAINSRIKHLGLRCH